jgi:hypothetical protein
MAAVTVALMAGCGAGGGGHPQVTRAAPGTAPVPAGLSLAAACAKFRSATIVMSEFGPTDPVALRRFGRVVRRLSGELAAARPGPDRALADALGLVSVRALALAAGRAPNGLIAAYNVVKRDTARADAACPGASQ